MACSLTRDLGRFVAGARFADVPQEALGPVRMAFADTVCVAIAGSGEQAPTLLEAMLRPGGREALLLGSAERASALDAAWINGTAAHALDFDDIAERGGHLSSVLVPAILAEAEAVGASGQQMVLAYAVGFETVAEIVRRDADQHHDKGWHPTPVFGAIGAAAACAVLRGCDALQAAMAIAISASLSGGVMSNVGTMTKPLHAGRAAHAGVAAARLARSGFTGALDALEVRSGFLDAVSPAGRIDVASPVVAGSRWQICGSNRLSVKKYPLCFFTHRALDAMLDLLAGNDVDPGNVRAVTVSMGTRNAAVLRYHAPATALEAKFSMEFAMACALVARRASLAELTEAFLHRPDVQALIGKVKVIHDEDEDPVAPGYSRSDRVVVELQDGRRLDSGPVSRLRGSADLPLRRDELWAKFEGCLHAGRARFRARELFDALLDLDRAPGTAELVRLLTPA